MSKIANDIAISFEYLLYLNPRLSLMSNIFVGDFICVGDNPQIITTTLMIPTLITTQNLVGQCNLYYTVKSGDYLSKIASDHRLTLNQLLSFNPNLTIMSTFFYW